MRLADVLKAKPYVETGPRADLIHAKALIADSERWSANGLGLYRGRMCMLASIMRVAGLNELMDIAMTSGTPYWYLLYACGEYPGEFNDTHTHAECMAVMDLAIELAS